MLEPAGTAAEFPVASVKAPEPILYFIPVPVKAVTVEAAVIPNKVTGSLVIAAL
tara:strand:+ start:272 stop:433 length:162 start_codon:yes stop_codon:yes gene_type:complete